jgi:hypothetical protein
MPGCKQTQAKTTTIREPPQGIFMPKNVKSKNFKIPSPINIKPPIIKAYFYMVVHPPLIIFIPVCNQDGTMIYNRHGGEPCRDKQISVRKK